MTHFKDRHYVIISSGDAKLIDFNEVMETSINTLLYSLDGIYTFVKYDGEMPPSVIACSSKSQEYSHEEMLEILSKEPWVSTENIQWG